MALTPARLDEGAFKVVAESTGNKTYKEHLDSLYNDYISLTQEQRRRTIVTMSNVSMTNSGSGNTGSYFYTSVAANLQKIYFYTIRIGNDTSNYVETQLALGNAGTSATINSKTDHSSETYNGTLQLLLAL